MRAGLPAFGWTDAKVVPGVTPARALHLLELRSALGEAYVAAGRPAPAYSDAAVTPGVAAMRAVHLLELRRAVLALEGAPEEVFRVGPGPGETAEDGPPGGREAAQRDRDNVGTR